MMIHHRSVTQLLTVSVYRDIPMSKKCCICRIARIIAFVISSQSFATKYICDNSSSQLAVNTNGCKLTPIKAQMDRNGCLQNQQTDEILFLRNHPLLNNSRISQGAAFVVIHPIRPPLLLSFRGGFHYCQGFFIGWVEILF